MSRIFNREQVYSTLPLPSGSSAAAIWLLAAWAMILGQFLFIRAVIDARSQLMI